MAWVEQTERRGQKEKHYRDDSNPGKFRAVLTIHDQHYKDSGNAWQDVDEALVDDGLNGFDKKCDKTRHQFRIAGGGSYRWYPRRNVLTEYVDITEIQYYTNRWRTLNLPAAVWKQQSAEWDMTNLYASITNTWKRIKTDFILKDSTAYTRLRFAVAFTGLTYNDETGELTSTTDGLVWGSIDKPTAQDANDAPVTVTQTYTSGWIEWNVDTTGATYPIYVDPTLTDQPDETSAFDTFFARGSADTDQSTNNVLGIRQKDATSARVSALKWNLSSLSGATTSSRTVYFYNSAVIASDQPVTVSRILSANSGWLETGTWNYADGAGASDRWAGDTGNDGGADAGCSISGTDYSSTSMGTFTIVASDPNGTEYAVSLGQTEFETMVSANYGMALTGTSNTNHYLHSSSSSTSGYRPKLVVEYSSGATGTLAATLAAATSSAAGTVQVSGALSATLADATLSAVGTVGGGTVTGAADITLANATSAATGTVQVTGAASITLAAATSFAAGTVAIDGDANITLADATLSATGTGALTGAANITLANATVTGAGTVAIDGDAAITLADATVSATGTVASPGTSTGTALITLADATSAATGTVAIAGAASIALANATVGGVGTVAIAGALTATLANATVSGAGTVADVLSLGTANITLADATANATGTVAIAGIGSITLADATSLAIGSVYIYGTGAVTLAAATLSGTGTVSNTPTGPGTRDTLVLGARATLYLPTRKDVTVDN